MRDVHGAEVRRLDLAEFVDGFRARCGFAVGIVQAKRAATMDIEDVRVRARNAICEPAERVFERVFERVRSAEGQGLFGHLDHGFGVDGVEVEQAHRCRVDLGEECDEQVFVRRFLDLGSELEVRVPRELDVALCQQDADALRVCLVGKTGFDHGRFGHGFSPTETALSGRNTIIEIVFGQDELRFMGVPVTV